MNYEIGQILRAKESSFIMKLTKFVSKTGYFNSEVVYPGRVGGYSFTEFLPGESTFLTWSENELKELFLPPIVKKLKLKDFLK